MVSSQWMVAVTNYFFTQRTWSKVFGSVLSVEQELYLRLVSVFRDQWQ